MLKLWSQFNLPDIFKYLALAILLAIPLYQKFPVIGIGGTYVPVRSEDFLLLVAGTIWFIYLLANKPLAFFKDPLNIAFTFFLTAGFVSSLSAVFVTETATSHLAFLHWVRRIEYIIPFFITLTAVRFGAKPKLFVETLFVVVVFAFLYGLGQMHLDFPVVTTQNEEYSKGIALRWIPGARLPSSFAGHYDLAAFMVMAFPLFFACLFAIKKKISRILLFSLVIIPGYWLFLQTESRVSFLAYLVGVMFTLWILKKRFWVFPFLAFSIASMFLLSDLGLRYWQIINVYGQRMLSENTLLVARPVLAQEGSTTLPATGKEEPVLSEDRSTAIRLNVEWPRALRAFSKNPLLGTGYSSISLATDNDYLRLLGEVGIVGTIAFLLVISRLWEKVIGFVKKIDNIDDTSAYVAGFAGAFLGLLINATFIDVFEASKVVIIFWALAGVAVGLVEKRREVGV